MKPSHATKLVELIRQWQLGTSDWKMIERGKAGVTVVWPSGIKVDYTNRRLLEADIDTERKVKNGKAINAAP